MERTVAEVLPAVKQNKEGIETLVSSLQGQLEKRKARAERAVGRSGGSIGIARMPGQALRGAARRASDPLARHRLLWTRPSPSPPLSPHTARARRPSRKAQFESFKNKTLSLCAPQTELAEFQAKYKIRVKGEEDGAEDVAPRKPGPSGKGVLA